MSSTAAWPYALPRSDPRHGTYNGYHNLGCRCGPCTDANTEYVKETWRLAEVRLGPCSVDGCDRGQYAKGLCRVHGVRLRKHGDPGDAYIVESTVRETELSCFACGEWLPDSCFPHDHQHPHRRNRHKQCRECGVKARTAYRARTRVPCEDCGALVEGKGRANTRSGRNGRRVQLDPDRPYLCRSCAMRRHYGTTPPLAAPESALQEINEARAAPPCPGARHEPEQERTP